MPDVDEPTNRTSVIDLLPTEIWLHIFELAAPLPFDPLDVAAEDTGAYPLPSHIYAASMAARRALCLVCRRLYAPAAALLLRYVWLYRRGQAHRLALALQRRPRYGVLIRRLDVCCTQPDAVQISALDVRDILAHTAGLVCFRDSQSTYTNVGRHDAQYSAMMADVVRRCRDTLRRVRVSRYYERKPWTTLVEPFTACDALYALEIDLSVSSSVKPPTGKRLVFSSLRVLEVVLCGDSDALDAITMWRMPRLHTLRILGSLRAGHSLSTLMAAHGARLKHLELSPCAMSSAAVSLASLTPNLRILTVTACRGHAVPHALIQTHMSLEQINIRDIACIVTTQHHTDALTHLSALNQSSFPRLKVVRVISCTPTCCDGQMVSSALMQHFWARWLETCAREGFAIQAVPGIPIEPSLADLTSHNRRSYTF